MDRKTIPVFTIKYFCMLSLLLPVLAFCCLGYIKPDIFLHGTAHCRLF